MSEPASLADALTLAAVLWAFRRLLVKRELPEVHTDGRSSALLGATITAVELPTAFPYFAAIAAVVGSGYGVWHQVFLILIFNIAFVLPLPRYSCVGVYGSIANRLPSHG